MLSFTKKKKLHEVRHSASTHVRGDGMHQVESLANVIVRVARLLSEDCGIVDCGAGGARLSHCLAMQFGLKVCAIEANQKHAASSDRWCI